MFFERVTKYTHLDNNRGGEGREGRVYGSLKEARCDEESSLAR